jgi:hypothetical protein
MSNRGWETPMLPRPSRGWDSQNYGYRTEREGKALVPWWTPREEDKPIGEDLEYDRARARSVVRSALDLQQEQSEVHSLHLAYGQMYDNRSLAYFDYGTNAFVRASMRPVSTVIENHIKRAGDTLVSLVGKNRPKATVVTRGADFARIQAAHTLDKWIWGNVLNTDHYSKATNAFRCSLPFGFGGVRICYEEGHIEQTEIFPDDIIVSQREVAATGHYSHLFHRRVLPLEAVAEEFGCDPDELLADESVLLASETSRYRQVGRGWVVVVEAWLRATDGGPGRYVAATSGRLLRDEAWDREWLPFVFFHYSAPISGRSFYTPSLVEQLLPYQIRYNEICEVIRNAQDLSRAICFNPIGSRVDTNVLYAKHLRVVNHTPGMAPSFQVMPTVDPSLYEERARIPQEMFADTGLNSMSNASMPANMRLDSSKAVREVNLLQDGRLADLAQRFEKYHLEVFQMFINVASKYATKGETTLWYAGGNKTCAETIDWGDLKLDDDDGDIYTLQLEASSAFTMSPSAMRDTIEDQFNRGLITKEEYMEQLATPDSESVVNVATAMSRSIKGALTTLLKGLYVPPSPDQDLTMGIQMVTASLLDLTNPTKYKRGSVPKEVISAHRQWVASATAILQRATNANTNGQAQPNPMEPMNQPPGMMSPATMLAPPLATPPPGAMSQINPN